MVVGRSDTVIVGCLALIAWGCSSTTLHHDFPDYAAAIESDVYRNGWLPDTLPKSARNILVVNDLDVNRVWARFEFDAGDTDVLTVGWEQRTRKTMTFQSQYGTLRTEWWDLDPAPTNGLDYFAQHQDNGSNMWREFLAVDQKNGIAWYWAVLDH